GGRVELKDNTTRFVGVPAMNAVCKALAEDLHIKRQCRIRSVTRDQGSWSLTNDQGDPMGTFDFVLSSAPPPQTAELLGAAPDIAARAEATPMQACWAVMLTFDSPLGLDFDGAFVHESPLSWVARNSSKPARNELPESWLLHASGPWTHDHLDDQPEAVLPELVDAFWQAADRVAVGPATATAHRWLYALPPTPLENRYLFDASLQLGACGDWCGGPRVEGAYLSGLALADAVIAARV
ncbi:MAG: FAD-dependent oxidoreductase, partial [Pirellulales bacterium]|nr:FAD-dependent oxidoreductase [Pirellulales bacterium]